MDSLKAATVSFTCNENRANNLKLAYDAIKQSKQMGADWVLLPEVFNYHGPYDALYENAEQESGEIIQSLSRLAKEHQQVIFAGSIGERSDNAEERRKVYNTMFVIGKGGEVLARYRKTHLFNLKDENGRHLYCESDGFLSGDSILAIDVDGWQVGLAICYDLRFPEFFIKLAEEKSLDAIVLPAAFTEMTGRDHWELLLRARAVEQQCYVIAANQCGEHRPGRRSYGHSLIIDPWGEVLADTGDGPGVVCRTISKKRIDEVRHALPSLANRRRELY